MSSPEEVKAQHVALMQAVQVTRDPKTKKRKKYPPQAWKALKAFARIDGAKSPDSQSKHHFGEDGKPGSRRQSLDGRPTTSNAQVKRTTSIKSCTTEYLSTAREVVSYTNQTRQSTGISLVPNTASNQQTLRKPVSGNAEGMLDLSGQSQPPTISKFEIPAIDLEKMRLESEEGSVYQSTISKLQCQLQDTHQDWEFIRNELRNAQEDHKQSEVTWKRRVDDLNARLNDARIESDKDHAEILRRKHEAKTLQDRLASFSEINQELEEIVEQNKKLEAENNSLRGESEFQAKESHRLQAELNRLVQQKASEAAPVDLYYYDNSYFVKQFNSLRGDIKNWANLGFSRDVIVSRVSETAIQRFSSITPHWQEYMASSEHRPAFIQAFVWTHLLYAIFGHRVWETNGDYASALLNEYYCATGKNYEIMRMCHEWRSTGARLAAERGTEVRIIEHKGSKSIARAVDAIREILKDWLIMGRTQAIEMLQKIVKSAVMLDLQMQQQKAYFTLFGGQHLATNVKNSRQVVVEYREEMMEIRIGKVRAHRQPLALLITPVLQRFGSTDGQQFENSLDLVLERAEVDVEPPKKSRLKGWIGN